MAVRMRWVVLGILSVGLMLLGLAGCDQAAPGSSQPASGAGKLRVVCTTTMITDLAIQIAGDDAQITGIMRTREDPHVYDVKPRDAQLIAQADLVLVNGLHLESTLGRVIEHNARGKVVALAEDPRITPLASQTAQGAPDPHCWFNVPYFAVYAQRARDALAEADPAHAENYRRRAQDYLQKLEALDGWVRRQLDQVPRQQRVMVTSHDAFQYFGQAYGIDVHAVIGMSTEEQPKPQDVQRLVELVQSRGVRALFIETSVSQTLNDIVRKVADQSGARIGGTLYSDSLGEPDSEAGTYLGMVRHNVTTLVEALR